MLRGMSRKILGRTKDFLAASMILIALSRAKKAYQAKYGRKHTNESLGRASRILVKMADRVPDCQGLFGEVSASTLEAIARPGFYNASLKRLNTLCYLLDTTADELLEYTSERLAEHAAAGAGGKALAPDDKANAGSRRMPDGEPGMPISLDPVSRAVVGVIEMNDCLVDLKEVGETYRATAKHRDGQVHAAEGTDLFRTICDLAENVGIKLEDG